METEHDAFEDEHTQPLFFRLTKTRVAACESRRDTT